MSNEAAERLRRWLAVDGRYADAHPTVDLLVDAALAAERRLTMEVMRHTLQAINDALDKKNRGDSVESDLLEAHATLDSAIRGEDR